MFCLVVPADSNQKHMLVAGVETEPKQTLKLGHCSTFDFDSQKTEIEINEYQSPDTISNMVSRWVNDPLVLHKLMQDV